jgi:hypothetical protein
MAAGQCARSSLRVTLLLALLLTPRMIFAQDAASVSMDSDFYRAVTTSTAPTPTNSTPTPEPLLGAKAPEKSPLADQGTGGAVVAPAPSVSSGAATAPREDQRSAFIVLILSVPRGTWAILVLSIVAGGFLLWAQTPLPCLLLGHRRSKMRVRFSDQHQRWVGNCKRCNTLLVRDARGGWKSAKGARVHPTPVERRRADEAPTFVFAPERKERSVTVEQTPPRGEETTREFVPVEVKARSIASQLLDDVRGGTVPTPGARGALFSVVDELRARVGPDEHTLCAEKISIRMQQLECALQRGDEKEAKSARRDLKTLAGEWMADAEG